MYFFLILLIIVLYKIKNYMKGALTNKRKCMKDKVVIVTGASSGIGKENAFQLLEDGANVIFACRDKTKTLNLLNQIKNKALLSNAHFIKLDLASFGSVKEFVKEFKAKFSKLDVLINNAGAFPIDFCLTEDKIDSYFQGNYLSHVLLTLLLLDYFDPKEGKILNVASLSHQFSDLTVRTIDELFNDKDFSKFKKFFYRNLITKNTLYGNTKMGNIFFTDFLSEYLEKKSPHIKAASLHPGIVRTEFIKFIPKNIVVQTFFYSGYFMYYLISKNSWYGAQTQLHLAYMKNEELINGAYYNDCKLCRKSSNAEDPVARNYFMKSTLELIKGHIDLDSFKFTFE